MKPDKKVLVAGDLMIDRYYFGEVDRISPEAPVPIVKVRRDEERPGAAANVAENLEAMGVDVKLIGSKTHVLDPVIKTRIIANGQQIARVDFDPKQHPLSASEVLEAAEGREIVVLSDYGKGTLDDLHSIIWHCKLEKKEVFVDAKSRRLRNYTGADLLKPNLNELRTLIGPWDSEEELEFKVKAMQRAAGISSVLLTRGAAGMTLFSGAVYQIKNEWSEAPVDVCGAGDTALAALVASWARGFSLLASARFANKAAGIAVKKFGTVAIRWGEIFK